MSDESSDRGENSLQATATFGRLSSIDAICDAFVSAWRSGQRPRIEDYLEGVPETARLELLADLLREEGGLRRLAGESVTTEEYLARFPNHPDTVHRALSVTSMADGVGSTIGNARSVQEGTHDEQSTPATTPAIPVADRYRKVRKLGEGAFGTAWLAEDLELRRHVALKEPRAERLRDAASIEAYLAEARVLASLDHPHIVPVYDVGRTADGSCYVVSKRIDGMDLAAYVKQKPLSFNESAQLVAQVAEALQHTHNRGLVHRDIKPANILIDTQGRPYVTDFGLALRDEDLGPDQGVAGTPAYMSPEQARGEGHLIDGRSDVFSLGVVLYELLTSVRPFRGKSWRETLEQVTAIEAKPPRQRNEAIPKELERICLKAPSKRAADRYTCAADLADDLRRWPQAGQQLETADRPARIVPKGIRSFDAADSDFFLELLPGPRDRDGLPESLRFWKTRIEETDSEKTFRVGLIYGPSGCGKSSLMKAGLLPRLADHVIRVFAEATSDDTEARLLQGLRRACADLPRDASLADTLAVIRRGRGIPAGRKIVLVLDQFEQWLYAHGAEQNTELAAALRQCDGQRIQAVLLVRDDFWMPVSEFLWALEVPLLEGINAGAVSLFDTLHARKVLAEFGKAYGRLPENLGQLAQPHEAFLNEAVSGLAQDGKVICVRLALLADMLKGRPWTPEALQEVGGTAGVGTTFLEETFSSRSAPPQHRQHQQAARAVLKALLPTTGTDIKGHMRTAGELRDACGYAGRRQDFVELIRILDSEVRLVTPVSAEGQEPAYQLTHDYLVPALHDWLTRKQRETRRGRAELRLAERSALWSARPENRHLPSWWEWPNIVLFTRRRDWAKPELRMMRAAGRYHGLRFVGILAAVFLAAYLGFEFWQRGEQRRADTLAEVVFPASAEDVPYALDNLRPLGRLAIPRLQQKLNDPQAESEHRLHAAYALADLGESPEAYLLDAIPTVPGAECRNIVAALQGVKSTALPELSRRSNAATEPLAKARYAIVALGLGYPRPAQEVLSLRPDPISRTTFIHGFADWHCDLAVVAKLLLQHNDAAFRSGLCAALGTMPWESIPTSDRDAVSRTLAELYTQAPDGGTHSAAGWALRQWKQELPAISATAEPTEGRHWHVNGQGMTMLAIPEGEIRLSLPTKAPILRSFLLADREVTVEQFLRFVDDAEYPAAEKPAGWKEDHEESMRFGHSPASDGPVQNINWLDAVLYCNWLSANEGLHPAYERTSQKLKRNFAGERETAWRCDFKSSGYRLPTEAEWEYACRALTASEFCFGDDEDHFAQYGWWKNIIQKSLDNQPRPGGMKLPNGWGLFDMHGNLWEWCDNLHITDVGTERRALRGGAFEGGLCPTSSSRYHSSRVTRAFIFGFRPARNYP